MLVPVSAVSSWAEVIPTPGISSSCSTARTQGAICSSIRAVTSSIRGQVAGALQHHAQQGCVVDR
jgi:hypothetical protein